MATAARLYKSGSFRLTGSVLETKPPTTNGVVGALAFDECLRPTPLAVYTADTIPSSYIAARHSTYPDLVNFTGWGYLVTVPGLTGKRYAVVEFDAYFDNGNTGMPIGFLNSDNSTNLDLYVNGGSLGMNAWSSQQFGAAMPTLNQRVRVTYVVDTTDMTKNRMYYNGVAQTMSQRTGTALTGSRIISNQVVIGNGRWDATTSYLFKQWMGNVRFYSMDPDSLVAAGLGTDDYSPSVFVGQTTTNLAMSAGARTWNFNTGTDGTETAIVANQRYQFTKAAAATNTRMYFQTSYLTGGETYTLSLKWRPITAGATFDANDWCDTSLTSYSNVDMGGWYQMRATGTRATYDATYRFMDFNTPANATVEVWDVQLENKLAASAYTDSARSTFGLLKFTLDLPADHTISGTRQDLLDVKPKTLTITKSGTTFTLYENGVATTTHLNKWRVFAYHRPTVNYGFNGVDNLKRVAIPDGSTPAIYENYSTTHESYLARTFLYSDADVRIWHRYGMDNGGYIRVNGRDVQSCGGWDPSTNPDVYIDLKVGWNVVELVGMDGDSGGTVFSLVDNSGGANTSTGRVPSVAFSAHPNVKYMTSDAPIDYLNAADGAGWTHGVNSFLGGFQLYNRAVSATEAKKMGSAGMDLDPSGNWGATVSESEPNLWPDPDVTVIPSVQGNGTKSIGTDDGRYYQNTFTSTTYTYVGYDIPLETGATYIVSGEFWRSAGSTPTYTMLAIEGSSAGSANGPAWSGLPEATWVRCEATIVSDGNARVLVYPTGGTAGSGTFRWRNMSVRKLPTKALSVSSTVAEVGELVEL